jgi:hypothetical protein
VSETERELAERARWEEGELLLALFLVCYAPTVGGATWPPDIRAAFN